MKKFERPELLISKFDAESITTSGVNAADAGTTALKEAGVDDTNIFNIDVKLTF